MSAEREKPRVRGPYIPPPPPGRWGRLAGRWALFVVEVVAIWELVGLARVGVDARWGLGLGSAVWLIGVVVVLLVSVYVEGYAEGMREKRGERP